MTFKKSAILTLSLTLFTAGCENPYVVGAGAALLNEFGDGSYAGDQFIYDVYN